MLERSRRGTVGLARLELPAVLVVVSVVAVSLHRSGHPQGDDYALYLRQARSVFDGDAAAVIADNRFAVENSGPLFSPVGYPWVWPLLMSPFVRLWGFDYDRLKLLEVAMLCVWLAFVHGIVRRRLGRIPALFVVAVLGTAPAYLEHTGQLLTEIPHLAAVTVFIWWFDRVRSKSSLVEALIRDLVVLGACACLAFNVRRESIVLVAVVAVMQVVELVRGPADRADPDRRQRSSRPTVHGIVVDARVSWQVLVAPHVSFVVSVALFQFLLPTQLLPDNDNDRSNIDDRMSEFPAILSRQIGLDERTWVGLVVLALAVAGVVVGLRRRPHLDGPLLLVAVLSALAISTHFRKIERYWFQVTPWALYFALAAVVAGVELALRRRERLVPFIAVVPLAALVVYHFTVLPDKIADARDFNDRGLILSGPTDPDVVPVYDAVRELTPPDAIVAFHKARTMTLLTERRAIQNDRIDLVRQRADYFAQRRKPASGQFDGDVDAVGGFVEVWSDDQWILWRVSSADQGPPAGSP